MALFSNKSCQISRVLETVTSVRQGLYGLVLTATLTIQVDVGGSRDSSDFSCEWW
jgi:hypothetical protein